jgi:predicted tellurium resistance membrane protein TerC
MALVADGLHLHIPRGYLYFAIAFSAALETLNLLAARARKRRLRLTASGEIVEERP